MPLARAKLCRLLGVFAKMVRRVICRVLCCVFALTMSMCVAATRTDAEELPIQRGERIATARIKLLQAGWRPVETFLRLYSPNTYEHRVGGTGELYKRGYVEVEVCSGTGRNYCRFNYIRNGQCLTVVTAGETKFRIDGWLWECPGEIGTQRVQERCKQAPDGKCHWFKGTLSLQTETLTRDDNGEAITIANDWPRNLNRAMDRAQHRGGTDDAWIHGTFEMCPIRRKDTGKRFVCIETAKDLKAVRQ
jgi:hypothetical protein